MTVGELIAKLKEIDPNRIVIMAKDAEGNGYSPLSDFWIGAYRAETTWMGDVGSEELTEEMRQSGYTEEDVIRDGQPAIILSPVN